MGQADRDCMAYTIEFAESVKGHLKALTATRRATVLAKIEGQLTNQPLVETRHRKPLRPNPIAPWELRVGQLRVFYDVSEGPPATVRILAVGVKDRNIVRIGKEEIQL
jgi:mRNA-degrading endonuclease RelE of RelBE toxin-antitoxin system